MENKFRIMLLSMATLGLFSCSDKLTDDGLNRQDDGKYAYFNAAISLPSASGMRSSTDDGPSDSDEDDKTNSDGKDSEGKDHTDYEYGYDYENDVRSIILVIAKGGQYITHAVVPSITQTSTTGNEFKFTVKSKIPYNVLEEAYGTGGVLSGTDKKVELYAYCNYTADILDKFETISDGDKNEKWLHWYGTVEEEPAPAGKKPSITNSIWAQRSFLMTNAIEYTTDKFPTTLGDWERYATQSNPLDLTKETTAGTPEPLPVERVAARFDFKDGSDNEDNTYAIQTITGTEDGEDVTANLFSVQLTRMALVNMSKNFYYLRRTSTDGQATDGTGKNHWKIGGKEYGNYVVDVDAANKIASATKGDAGAITPENADQYFNFTLFDTNKNYDKQQWYIDDIEDVLSGSDDNWTDDWAPYKIWRYVTENTIPAKKVAGKDEDDVSQQKTIQSIGVVFKGAIIAGEDMKESGNTLVTDRVAKALQDAALPKNEKTNIDFPVLYSFNNLLYAGIDELIEAAYQDGQNGPLYSAVEKALEAWGLKDGCYTHGVTGTGTTKLTLAVCHSIIYPDEETEDATVDFWGDDATVEAVKEFMKAVAQPEVNITVYEATDEGDSAGMGYYCYYFYWNRHNDNLKSGKMGPMEFATVRNNVYKLSVKEINQLGHPRDADHDPDPVDPEDPDEDPMNYIKVQVEVLPWVVRVNDIVF